MSEEAKWYVVHTYSGYENKVAATIEKAVENRKLEDLILEVQVPMEEVTEIQDSKRKTVERKMFPGYVLVKMVMTDESWHVVRNTRGVTGFVGPASKAVALTDSEVKALGVEKKPEIVIGYAEGDSVRVIDGPFEGYFGVVEEISMGRGKVRIRMSMFGRETPTELEFDQVEPAVQ